MNRSRGRPLCLVLTMVFLLWAGSSPGLALDTINVSHPSPAPFNTPVEAAIHQAIFREQNLAVELIATRAKVDRAALISGDIRFTLRIGSALLSAAGGLPVRTAIPTGANRFGCETIPKLLAAEPSKLVS